MSDTIDAAIPDAPDAAAPDVDAGLPAADAPVPWWDKFKRQDDDGDDEAEASDAAPVDAEASDHSEEPANGPVGSEQDPLTLDALPDQYVRVRVDGQDVVLSLRDCAQRGISAATMHRRMAEVASVRKDLEQELGEARSAKDAFNGWLQRVKQDPAFVRSWFRRHAPEAFSRAAEAEISDLVNTTPDDRAARQLAEERARFEAEQESWRKQQQEQTQRARIDQSKEMIRTVVDREATKHGVKANGELFALLKYHLDPIFVQHKRHPTEAEVAAAVSKVAPRLKTLDPRPAPAAAAPPATPPRTPQRGSRSAPRAPSPPAKKPTWSEYWNERERYASNGKFKRK